MSDTTDTTVILFGSLDGVEQPVIARPVEDDTWEVVSAPTALRGVNPGARFKARPLNGRLCYSGNFQPGPIRSGRLYLEDDVEMFAAQLGLVDTLAEEGALDPSLGESPRRVAVEWERMGEIQAVVARAHDEAGAHLVWDPEYQEGTIAANVLVPTSLDALVTTFRGLITESIPTDINACGHLHVYDAATALGFTGIIDQDEHARMPLSLASRLPVDLTTARLVDSRAVTALSDLSEPHVEPLEMVTFLVNDDEVEEPVLWVSALLVVTSETDGFPTETVALVELPYDVRGSRLHLDESAGQGVLIWATNLAGHDESLVLSFVTPADGVDERDPIQVALSDAFDDLRDALKDYALMDMLGERDHLRHVLHSRH